MTVNHLAVGSNPTEGEFMCSWLNWIEQQPSKLMVIGSSPIEHIALKDEKVVEWLKAIDCKSIDVSLRGFKSHPFQNYF